MAFTSKDDLTERLHAAGLRVRQVAADGNCWFRALADQLQVCTALSAETAASLLRDAFETMQGDEGAHMQLRHDTVEYMRAHAEDFSAFMEDDEPLDKYLSRMRKVSASRHAAADWACFLPAHQPLSEPLN